MFLRRYASVFAILCLVLSLVACSKGRKRPPGFLKIGNLCELPDLPEQDFLGGTGPRIILRRDRDGYTAMSTQCTFDLSDLHRVGDGPSARLRSRFNESEYSLSGEPMHGPAVAPLPYYELELSSGVYGGPSDTLYVRIGSEVSPGWRLKVDRAAICAATASKIE